MNSNPSQGGLATDLADENWRLIQSNAELRAEVERLRGVLERILDGGYVSESIEEERADYLLARAALQQTEK